MNTITLLTYLLIAGAPTSDGGFRALPIAEFQTMEDCETIRDGLTQLAPKDTQEIVLVCLESTEYKNK